MLGLLRHRRVYASAFGGAKRGQNLRAPAIQAPLPILAALFLLPMVLLSAGGACAEEGIADTVDKIKPGIVGVGTYQRTRNTPLGFRGTGFAIGDGMHILTNAHVLPDKLDKSKFESLAVLVRENDRETMRLADEVGRDEAHDIALLKIGGPPLRALPLGNSDKVREGEIYAFTGYPIGVVLGLHPVTHRGMISAITPIAIPVQQSRELDKLMFSRLHDPYEVFQLDATAYPGNSGSPLYDTKTGAVVGIINKVFVQESKEHVLDKPSGISYAIPIRYALTLLKKLGIGR
jgi:S1-C subfamily serine protease